MGTKVRVTGGGARSGLWRKIVASVLGVEVATVANPEGAAFGAALLAGVGAGAWPDVTAACDATVSLTIYNRAGECVWRRLDQEDLPAGRHDFPWDGTDYWGNVVSPGVYDYVLDYVANGVHRRVLKKLVVARE